MRTLLSMKQRRKFDSKWYELDYTAERGHWDDFNKRLAQVKKHGWNYRVVVKTYPQFGTYKALYVRGI